MQTLNRLRRDEDVRLGRAVVCVMIQSGRTHRSAPTWPLSSSLPRMPLRLSRHQKFLITPPLRVISDRGGNVEEAELLGDG